MFISSSGGFRRAGVRDCYGLRFVVKGRGRLLTAGREYPLETGDLFAIWPETPFDYSDDPQAPWDLYCYSVHGPGMREYISSLGLSPENPVLPCPESEDVLARFKTVWDYAAAGERKDPWTATALLFSLTASFRTAQAAPYPAHTSEGLVGEAMTLGGSFLETGIGVLDLADMLHVSHDNLNLAFRRHLGITPSEWLQQARLRRAKQLLTETDEKILTISAECGFKYEKYFYRFFKKHTGLTPGAWRRKA